MPDEFDDEAIEQLRRIAGRSIVNSMPSTGSLSSVVESLQSSQRAVSKVESIQKSATKISVQTDPIKSYEKALAPATDSIPKSANKLARSSMLDTMESCEEMLKPTLQRLSELEPPAEEVGDDPEIKLREHYVSPLTSQKLNLLDGNREGANLEKASNDELIDELEGRREVITCPDCGEIRRHDGTPVVDEDERRCSRCSDTERSFH